MNTYCSKYSEKSDKKSKILNLVIYKADVTFSWLSLDIKLQLLGALTMCVMQVAPMTILWINQAYYQKLEGQRD